MGTNDERPPVAVNAEPPAGWIDKSMIIHSAPLADGQTIAPTIVIARDALGGRETFREYCNRQIDGFRVTLPQYFRESEGPGRLHERDAFQIQFMWASGAGTLRQRVFFISAGSGVVVTFTTTAAADDYARHEPVFEQSLAHLAIAPAPGNDR
ncbi:DcrB-related protein [Sphingomonas sp.]|uniref:DcrB-related protein n=1 Tax=Sphingomonas sp. TaxID=28214 RepID=UPI003D6D9E31